MAVAEVQLHEDHQHGSGGPGQTGTGRSLVLAGIIVAAATALGFILYEARTTPGPRILNPHPLANPHAPFMGVSDWPLVFEVASLILAVVIWTTAIRRSRRQRAWTPTLMMLVASTALCVLDPIMNWAPYAVYNPRLLHFPESWAWASISPSVEPLVILVGYPYFFLIPAWVTLTICSHFVAGRRPTSFVRRHPLVTVFITGFLVCMVWDGVIEALLVRMEVYSYVQVIGSLSFRSGTSWQFPLYEAPFFGFLLAFASLMMWRDDSGLTTAARLAKRWNVTCSRPNLGPLAMAFVIMFTVYVGYGLAFGVIRDTHVATTVARPWPYQTVKVYDPQGDYQRSGVPGPYFSGIWCGWESAQSGKCQP
jgi:hypothetical protein